jgi:predicted metal-dependent enzyme (double-stranded beta helix superfamily)
VLRSTFSAPFAAFVDHAEAHIDDPHAIADRLALLLREPGWLAPEHQIPGVDTYRQHLLHVSPTRRLSVVALVWLPGQHTPIHDHVSWCVVGVYRGIEQETRYRLVEAGARQSLLPVGDVLARPGHVEALVPPAEDIHSVTAAGTEMAVSIHVYGADIEKLGSSIHRRFDDVPILPAAAAA